MASPAPVPSAGPSGRVQDEPALAAPPCRPPWGELWRGGLVWLVVALAVRTLTAWYVTAPGYIDAYYYYHVASRVAAGQGLTETVVWNYLTPPLALPRPSSAYWPPGASLFAVLGALPVLAAGAAFSWRAAQVAPVLGSSLLVAASYALSRRLSPGEGAARRASCVAGMALFSGVYFPYWVTTDTFTPFALLGGGALWLAAEAGSSVRRRPLFLAGALVGLAQAVRPDGLLLALAPLVAALSGNADRRARRSLASLVGVAAGATPWLVRNRLVWHTLTPPGASRAFWLSAYDDLFAVHDLPSASRLIGGGLAGAAQARLAALAVNVAVFGQPLLFYLAPFLALGLWRRRRQRDTRPVLAYLAALYAAMSLLFPFQGPRGGEFHSLAAALPFMLLWVVIGVETAVAWAGRKRGWHVERAQRAFSGALVCFGAIASLYFAHFLGAQWNAHLATYRGVAAWLDAAAPRNGRVMAVDPPGFWYASGREAVVTPSDGYAALQVVVARVGVSYVLVEQAAPAYLALLYEGGQPPPELSYAGTVDAVQIYRVSPAVEPAGATTDGR